jgi:hypothetical protein
MSASSDSSKADDYNPRMSKLLHALMTSLVGAVVAAAAVGAQSAAPTKGFTLDQVLNYPFPDNLVASPRGSTIAWTFNERGARNIYIADGPEFQARRLTT